MHSLKVSGRFRDRALAAGMMLMASSVAMGASDGGPADWQYGLAIYGWFPSVSGSLAFTPPGGGSDIEADAEDIIGNLDMIFMGSFEARKGRWSGFTDLIYLDLSGDKTKSVSAPTGNTRTLFDADLELKGWIWTLGGAYTAWRDEESFLDLFAGARLLALDADMKLTGGGPLQRQSKLSASEDLWDGIIGAKGNIALKDKWYVPYYVDVGTGDTDLTWQVAAGIGYAFNWGDVQLKYRYLEYDQGSDGLMQNIGFGGPQLGVAFRF